MRDTRQDGLMGWIFGGLVVLALLAAHELLGERNGLEGTANFSLARAKPDEFRPHPASGGPLARVTYVPDGDSLVVIRRGEEIRVRLLGIDAPEKGQVMASASRSLTEQLCLRHDVELVEHGTDKYDRLLAEVYVDGVYVNQELLRAGLAWCFDERNVELLQLEQDARAKQIGIWSELHPIRPSDWRRSQP